MSSAALFMMEMLNDQDLEKKVQHDNVSDKTCLNTLINENIQLIYKKISNLAATSFAEILAPFMPETSESSFKLEPDTTTVKKTATYKTTIALTTIDNKLLAQFAALYLAAKQLKFLHASTPYEFIMYYQNTSPLKLYLKEEMDYNKANFTGDPERPEIDVDLVINDKTILKLKDQDGDDMSDKRCDSVADTIYVPLFKSSFTGNQTLIQAFQLSKLLANSFIMLSRRLVDFKYDKKGDLSHNLTKEAKASIIKSFIFGFTEAIEGHITKIKSLTSVSDTNKQKLLDIIEDSISSFKSVLITTYVEIASEEKVYNAIEKVMKLINPPEPSMVAITAGSLTSLNTASRARTAIGSPTSTASDASSVGV